MNNVVMNDDICKVLVQARELNDFNGVWVPFLYLVKYGMTKELFWEMEDHELITTQRSGEDGWLMKLTLKGYQRCKFGVLTEA